MKHKLILAFFLLLPGVCGWAQSRISKSDIKKAVAETALYYGLDKQQQEKVYALQERHFSMLEEIEVLKGQNEPVYQHKRRAVQLGTEGAIREILNPGQEKKWLDRQKELLQQHSDRIRILREQGAGKEAIQKALLEIQNN